MGEAYHFGGNMGDWYVIQVRTGTEDKIVKACELLVAKECLDECFIPRYIRVKKIRGFWTEVNETLFPGYIFMISKDVNMLFQELKRIPDLTKMLGKFGNEIFPLNEDEVAFLKSFGKDDHIVDMSVGYIEGDKVVVTSGPMMGKEGLIKKVDRHKRLAFIEVEFFGKITDAKVGLEIIRKN